MAKINLSVALWIEIQVRKKKTDNGQNWGEIIAPKPTWVWPFVLKSFLSTKSYALGPVWERFLKKLNVNFQRTKKQNCLRAPSRIDGLGPALGPVWAGTCHEYEWVMSRVWMSHVTHTNESCYAYEWVMSHIWMSHVTHMNESCHTFE